MFGSPIGRLCDYVVRCKRCGENIPAPVATMPDTWIVAVCALCGEARRYLPNEIFRGRLAAALNHIRGHQGRAPGLQDRTLEPRLQHPENPPWD